MTQYPKNYRNIHTDKIVTVVDEHTVDITRVRVFILEDETRWEESQFLQCHVRIDDAEAAE